MFLATVAGNRGSVSVECSSALGCVCGRLRCVCDGLHLRDGGSAENEGVVITVQSVNATMQFNLCTFASVRADAGCFLAVDG